MHACETITLLLTLCGLCIRLLELARLLRKLAAGLGKLLLVELRGLGSREKLHRNLAVLQALETDVLFELLLK